VNIQGIEEALEGMSVGGIRRLIVPAGPLSYPEDTGFKKIGPVPNSFSGRRTLDFVMVNAGGIDKTLLMDIELLGECYVEGNADFLVNTQLFISHQVPN
jgi:hypothetical protein